MKPGRVEALTGWAGDWGPPLGKCFNYTTPKQNCNLYSKHSKGTKLKILFSVFVWFFFGALLKLTFCVKVITSVLLRFQFFEETKPLFPAAITSHTKSSVGNVNRKNIGRYGSIEWTLIRYNSPSAIQSFISIII